jgi:hypothetical protein
MVVSLGFLISHCHHWQRNHHPPTYLLTVTGALPQRVPPGKARNDVIEHLQERERACEAKDCAHKGQTHAVPEEEPDYIPRLRAQGHVNPKHANLFLSNCGRSNCKKGNTRGSPKNFPHFEIKIT